MELRVFLHSASAWLERVFASWQVGCYLNYGVMSRWHSFKGWSHLQAPASACAVSGGQKPNQVRGEKQGNKSHCSAISCGTSGLSSLCFSLAGASFCIMASRLLLELWSDVPLAFFLRLESLASTCKCLCRVWWPKAQSSPGRKTRQQVTLLSNLMWNFGSFFTLLQLGWSEFLHHGKSAVT